MKFFSRAVLTIALAGAMVFPAFGVQAKAAEPRAAITTTATGYTSAHQVSYKKSGNYIANWGARGEDCTFLSTYAQSFYTGSYVYDTLSERKGGIAQGDAPSSDLYKQLQALMKSKHSHQTSYNETRDQYKYTDCVRNDTSTISSFYSGKSLSGKWDGGDTWNREHTWPNSKGLDGNDENDIMMLRPTWKQENSSRGNTAYGLGSGYYDPGESVRGDCARIVLYVYVRWGNTGKMWGTSGVIQNMNVLLEWMAEDPVDTWEMGRNDAVQAITGTRNVFVDYPEYAWLLFGQKMPDDMVTPSGEAKNVVDDDSSIPDSSTGGETNSSDDENSSESGDEHVHAYGEWQITLEPTDTEDGERMRYCLDCFHQETEVLPKLSESGEVGCLSSVYGSSAIVGLALVALCGLRKRKRGE